MAKGPLEFGEFLGDLLESRGVSTSALARLMSVDESYVRAWRRNVRTPARPLVEKIGPTLSLTPDEELRLLRCFQYSRLKERLGADFNPLQIRVLRNVLWLLGEQNALSDCLLGDSVADVIPYLPLGRGDGRQHDAERIREGLLREYERPRASGPGVIARVGGDEPGLRDLRRQIRRAHTESDSQTAPANRVGDLDLDAALARTVARDRRWSRARARLIAALRVVVGLGVA